MEKLPTNTDYQKLIDNIGTAYESAKSKAFAAVNTEMLNAYWEIGKHIVEFEQEGEIKAQYGKALLEKLSKALSLKYGRGFSRTNLGYMRTLFIKYPI